ncbi:hypothetical protein V6Z11_A08G295700 [Gossypium hirsutum]|uniref:Water stress and hypersensitive response domain-containing protein n=1 Tax=Gossypium tomentosum TaxID=34277 RepID=A0A5D2PPJ1_GOSTO|nr:hypothetical protein ES332_A08G299300v1 [Gossypium tomentosum]
MSSSDKPEFVERDFKDKVDDKEDNSGFIDKVKGLIHDIGEKMEETIGFGKPTADVAEIHLPYINLEKAEIVVDVIIKNPNPVPIPLVVIDYLFESDGRKLISGLIPDAGTIHAHVDLIVDVPVFGRLTLPLEKTGEIPIPYKPNIDMEKIHFERFSWEETIADFGSALWDMIRGKGTGYSMKGHINVDTPFGALKLPISKEGGTTRLKKNREDGGDDDDDEVC